ncbi:hypothetical protein ACFQPG_00985 [Sphingomonas sp. GCM10030256]|uniref:hypothetical protein n=1 Tax=Sphingomonas sp. GCM10030256 TaxID=3273427 RepID=UPI00362154D3
MTPDDYRRAMSNSIVLRALAPWKFKRHQAAQRMAALRSRDGDHCFRCRRPLRFDLPAGHDRGARIETITPGDEGSLDNLCLTHGRCNAKAGCDTTEVLERSRLKNEAALFERARERRRA